MTAFRLTATDQKPSDIAAGRDGNMWFTEIVGNQIGRITRQGVIAEFPLPHGNGGLDGIILGPDGNMWFTECGDKIGRITLAGVITEFDLPVVYRCPAA